MIERHFIYFPIRGLDGDPSRLGMDFEDVLFTAEDGVRLHGWFVPGQGDITWVWFHGNAGNVSHRLENLKLLHDQLGVSVFLFDYRGYGRSEGAPSEQGTYRDAEAALAYLRRRPDVRQERMVYFGRSLGAAIATHVAASHPPYGLILESPFPSIPFMARIHYRFLPVGPLLRTRYDTLSMIQRVKAPLLILHGDRDDIVPIDAGRMVFDAAMEPKAFHVIEGASHNDTYLVGGERYVAALRAFLERLDVQDEPPSRDAGQSAGTDP